MNENPDPKTVSTRPRNKRLTIIVLVVVFVLFPVIAVFWMYPAWESSKVFERPAITMVHVDGEPFMRLKLGPGQSYRPIEVMAGTRVKMECEVLSRHDARRFVFTSFGTTQKGPACEYMVDIPEDPGRHDTVVFEFFDGNASVPTDVMKVPLVVISKGERLELHGLEDAEGNALVATSVSGKVVVYGRVIVKEIPHYRNLVPLFFVADSLDGRPVLQLKPTREKGETPSPLTGQLVLYRQYGEHVRGYALWSRDYLTVGGEKDFRKVFDIYYGLFPKDEVDEVFRKTLSVEWTATDTVRVRPLISSVKELRAMTYEGRFLSPPFHVVRGAGPVDSGVGP